MKTILFEHIPETGLLIQETLSTPALSLLLEEPGRPLAFEALGPAEVQMRIERKGFNDAVVQSKGHFVLSHACVRCLEPLTVAVDLDCSEKFEKPTLLDLEGILREELFLELPTYPVCEPGCGK